MWSFHHTGTLRTRTRRVKCWEVLISVNERARDFGQVMVWRLHFPCAFWRQPCCLSTLFKWSYLANVRRSPFLHHHHNHQSPASSPLLLANYHSFFTAPSSQYSPIHRLARYLGLNPTRFSFLPSAHTCLFLLSLPRSCNEPGHHHGRISTSNQQKRRGTLHLVYSITE